MLNEFFIDQSIRIWEFSWRFSIVPKSIFDVSLGNFETLILYLITSEHMLLDKVLDRGIMERGSPNSGITIIIHQVTQLNSSEIPRGIDIDPDKLS